MKNQTTYYQRYYLNHCRHHHLHCYYYYFEFEDLQNVVVVDFVVVVMVIVVVAAVVEKRVRNDSLRDFVVSSKVVVVFPFEFVVDIGVVGTRIFPARSNIYSPRVELQDVANIAHEKRNK